jgi:hypothetical protein
MESIAGPVMTIVAFYLATGVPMAVNAAMFGLLFASSNAGFEGINQRFDGSRELWRSEFHRFEEVLGARLKHLEERRG